MKGSAAEAVACKYLYWYLYLYLLFEAHLRSVISVSVYDLGAPANIWGHLEAPRGIWGQMGAPGAFCIVWEHWVTAGGTWEHLGNIWTTIRRPLWGHQARGMLPPSFVVPLGRFAKTIPPPLPSNHSISLGRHLPPWEMCSKSDDRINDIFEKPVRNCNKRLPRKPCKRLPRKPQKGKM